MPVGVYDRWHKTRAAPHERKCEHKLVPTSCHGKGKRWQVRWDVWVDGERQQPRRNFEYKVGKDPEIHANAFAEKLRLDLSTQRPAPIKELTLVEVGKEWVESLSCDDTSIYTIERRIENHVFNGDLSRRLIWELYEDPNLIQQWIKQLRARGQENNYTRAIALHLSSMLSFAAFKKYIPSNPMKDNPLVTIPNPGKRLVTPYTREQLDAITENLQERYRIIPKAGSGIGLRIGEIFGLSPDDIQGREVHIQRQVRQLHRSGTFVFAPPKRGKTRVVPLPDSLGEFLAGLPTTVVNYPWIRANGKPKTVRVYMAHKMRGFGLKAVTNDWNRAFVKAGMVRVPRVDTFHKLRHTYASVLLKAGIDIRTLALYMGHSDPGFTLREYCHFMVGDGDDARRAIDG